MLEHQPGAGELLHALVQITAFEVDGAGGGDLLVGIDLDREGRPSPTLEARIAVVRAVDDLPEAEQAVEANGLLVVLSRDSHLVQPRTAADIQTHLPMPHRPCALSQPRRFQQRHPDEFAPSGHGFGQRPAPSQAHCNGARQGAARAVGAGRVDPLTLPARHIVFFDQRVGQRVAFFVSALDQHGTAMFADQAQRGLDGIILASQPVELGQVRGGDGRQFHQPAEGCDGGIVSQHRPVGRHHHRIEDDRHVQILQPVGDEIGGECAADHPDLHRIHAEVAHHRINLREDDLRRDRVHGRDPAGVLGRDCGDRRHRVAAEHGDGLDVRLNTRSAAAVGPGNDEDAGNGHDVLVGSGG